MSSDPRFLWVEKLPAMLVGERLYEIFGAYGPIRQIRIGSDAATKGTAVVVFMRCEDADKARVALHGKQFGSRALSVTIYDRAELIRSMEKKKRKRDREGEYRAKLKADEGAS